MSTPSGPSKLSDSSQTIDAFITFIETQLPLYDDSHQEDVVIPLPQQFQIKNPQIIREICDRYHQAQWTFAEFVDRGVSFKLSRREIPPQSRQFFPTPPTSSTETSRSFGEFKVQFVQYVNEQRQSRDNGNQNEVEIPLPVHLRVFDADQQWAIKQLFYQSGWQQIEFAQGATLLRLYRHALRP